MAEHMEASEAPQRRLIITEMVLENFKSYAGEQRVGPFHKVRAAFMDVLPAVQLLASMDISHSARPW